MEQLIFNSLFKLVQKCLNFLLIVRNVILVKYFDGSMGQNINASSSLGLGDIHHAILRNTRPKKILCIGSNKGFVPAIFALACKENGAGHVDFVDAGYEYNNNSKKWEPGGFWSKHNWLNHFSPLGLNSRLTHYKMTTKDFFKKYPKKTYQYIYIDGDHTIKGVLFDYKHSYPLLEKGGLLLLHDININLPSLDVKRFWNQLHSTNSISILEDCGLGIIQKNI